MTVEIERDALLGALRAVADVVQARTTIPVLANLHLEVAGGRMTVTGTDLDLQASATAEAVGDLLTTVDKGKLLAAAVSFKAGKVRIEASQGRAVLKQGRAQRTISTLPATDFPRRGAIANGTAFRIAGKTLLRLLDAASIAQSTEETRYYLMGVLLHVEEGKLRCVATDGHRLVRAEADVPAGAEPLPDIIVPTKTVTLLRRLLGKADTEVAIVASDKAITFAIGNVSINSKIVEGTFPIYQRIIPTPGCHVIVGARDAIVEAFQATAAIVNAEGDLKVRAVKVTLDPSGEHEVSAQDSTGSHAIEPLDVAVEGGAFSFGVNHKYLVQVAGIFGEAGSLTMTMADSAAPMRITGDRDPDLIAVLMPMRV
ncbi:DNA polymerase III subunit beta [Sphingomonas beigongshangi]|uniref:DNA polymerase III subunit beta n=1 Tax=Sphingomonas beigongshangi TaxID=2782540 RepID=UPI001AEE761A